MSDKKKLKTLTVCGQHIDLSGRIVAVLDPEWSSETLVTFYSPETRGTPKQGESDFRTTKVQTSDYVVKHNATDKVQTLYWAEQDKDY